MKKKKLVHVSSRIEPDLRDRLDKLAKADSRTISTYIRMILTDYLNRPQRGQERAA